MKSFVISGSIDIAMAKSLVEFYNTLEKDNDCTVYVRSHGGFNDATAMVVDQLHRHAERTRIVFIGEVQSNGFKIFVEMCEYKTTEIVAPLSGMYHLGTLEVIMNANGPASVDDKEKVKYLKEVEANDLIPQRCDFTESELADYREGKDVYFSHNRMMEIMRYIKSKTAVIA